MNVYNPNNNVFEILSLIKIDNSVTITIITHINKHSTIERVWRQIRSMVFSTLVTHFTWKQLEANFKVFI